MSEWTFQAETGTLPTIDWFLSHLDRMGCPCAWRTTKPTGPAHPALRWAGLLLPASSKGLPRSAGVSRFETYRAVQRVFLELRLRVSDPHEEVLGRLLMVLADLIAHEFSGTCLAGHHVTGAGRMAREETKPAEKPNRPGQSVCSNRRSVLAIDTFHQVPKLQRIHLLFFCDVQRRSL